MFPVQVKGMKIRWFIRDPEGKKFLEAILNNNDLHMYKITTLQMIIEFFYLKYKNFLFRRNLPLFICRMTFFYTAMFTSEYTGDETAKSSPVFYWVVRSCQCGQLLCEAF